MPYSMKRRDFLGAAGAGLVATALPFYGAMGEVRRFQLTAGKADHLFDKDINPTDLWLYNNSSPGPALTARKGETIEVEFVNMLDQPTTIHWHGIRNINEMDGVPGLTQAAVEPGERFVYRFPVNDAGTYWYHAHNKTWEQVARGLYGTLIVTESDADLNDRDLVVVVDDWRLDNNDQIDDQTMASLHDWSHAGRLGNYLTVNGESLPQLAVPSSGPVRLRFINTANARVMSFALNTAKQGNIPMQVVALDGAACTPFDQDHITLAPAQRMDVVIEDASLLTTLSEISSGEAFDAARFAASSPETPVSMPRPKAGGFYPMPDITDATVVNLVMQGGAMGNLSSAMFEGEEKDLRDLAVNHQKLWAINGQVGGYDHILADVALGEVVVLRVWNDSRWPHGMHLHGQHFWVNSLEFGSLPHTVLRDTYLMQPQEKVDLIFRADNPGLWLFHCHMIEHHAAGLGGVIAVG